MKRLLFFALAVMGFAACTQNEVEEQSAVRHDAPDTITVGFEGDDTRIQLNEAQKTVWTKNDLVSVFYKSNANQQWEYRGETGERVAELYRVDAGIASRDMDYVVLAYPYNADYIISTTTGNIETKLPATQHYTPNSYGVGDNLMVSKSEFTQFSLKSVCGWLKLQLTGDGESVKSITLRGNNGEQVAGLVYVDTATAKATLASEMGSADDNNAGGNLVFEDTILTEVTLDCGAGVTLGKDATAFYIALPPQTFEHGFTVDVNCNGYKPMSISTQNDVIIERNHIQPMAEVAFSSDVRTIANNEIWYINGSSEVSSCIQMDQFNTNIISILYDSSKLCWVITFDSEVTTIGDNAFYNYESAVPSITDIILPESINEIGSQAFYKCELTHIEIPNGVTTIKSFAFKDCGKMTSALIGKSITTINSRAFYRCNQLNKVYCKAVTPPVLGSYVFSDNSSDRKIYVPSESVEAYKNSENWSDYALDIIGYNFETGEVVEPEPMPANNEIWYFAPEKINPYDSTAFGVNILTNEWDSTTNKGVITFDGDVTMIGDSAFYSYSNYSNCKKMIGVTLPNSVAIIGPAAFSNCNGLKSIEIPNNVLEIGDSAFADCYSLESITMGNNIHTIGPSAFCGCGFSNINIPNSVSSIGKHAFYGSSIESIIWPDSVTKIDDGMFHYCGHLVDIVIPEGITSIGDSAFRECHDLTSITLPKSIKYISNWVFYNSNLTELYIKAPKPPTIHNNTFGKGAGGMITLEILAVPTESIEAYRDWMGGKVGADNIVGYDF